MHFDVSVDSKQTGRFGVAPGMVGPGGWPTCTYRPGGLISFMFLNDRTELGGQTAIVPKFHKQFDSWTELPAAAAEVDRMRQSSSKGHPDILQVGNSPCAAAALPQSSRIPPVASFGAGLENRPPANLPPQPTTPTTWYRSVTAPRRRQVVTTMEQPSKVIVPAGNAGGPSASSHDHRPPAHWH